MYSVFVYSVFDFHKWIGKSMIMLSIIFTSFCKCNTSIEIDTANWQDNQKYGYYFQQETMLSWGT